MKNYFRINRSIFDTKLWLSEPFDKNRAWIDLIGNANYKDGMFFLRGNEVVVKRGQLAWSIRFMMKRWKWSQKKVENFLNYLKSNTQINTQNEYPISLISILNYEKYQGGIEESDTQSDTQSNTQSDTQSDTTLNKDNKDKKNKRRERVTETEKSKKKLYMERWTLEEVGVLVVQAFNTHLDTHFKDTKSFLKGLESWLEVYTPPEIEQAIKQVQYDKFWNGKMTPVLLFRHKNPNGEPVDYIGGLLNNKKQYGNTNR
jgi:hypothetical protein